MLLNNWFVTDSIKQYLDNEVAKIAAYLCLEINDNVTEISNLHQSLQKDIGFTPFGILISGHTFKPGAQTENLINAIISLFFQPSYYTINYHPVLFLLDVETRQLAFVDSLEKKCKKQGLRGIIQYTINTESPINYGVFPFCQLVSDSNINFEVLFGNWTHKYLESDKAVELNILFPKTRSNDIIEQVVKKENALATAEYFKVADRLYKKEKLIEQYQRQLYLKSVAEKDNRMYLSIQKAGRADALEWYYYEYEILPTWYKQFGHIIKVIMGKRSFRSLFNDNIKKYKD